MFITFDFCFAKNLQQPFSSTSELLFKIDIMSSRFSSLTLPKIKCKWIAHYTPALGLKSFIFLAMVQAINAYFLIFSSCKHLPILQQQMSQNTIFPDF
jgi:hypothetical protein